MMGEEGSDEENGFEKAESNQLTFNGNEERKNLHMNLKPEDSEIEIEEDDSLGDVADEL